MAYLLAEEAQQALRGRQEPQVQLERPDLQDRPELLDPRAQPDLQVRLVLPDRRGLLARQDLRALRAQLALQRRRMCRRFLLLGRLLGISQPAPFRYLSKSLAQAVAAVVGVPPIPPLAVRPAAAAAGHISQLKFQHPPLAHRRQSLLALVDPAPRE